MARQIEPQSDSEAGPVSTPVDARRTSFWSLTALAWERLFGYDFFVSYSRKDGRAYAESIVDKLSARPFGYRCFIDDREMGGGVAWRNAVQKSLRRSAAMVLVATPQALVSDFVYSEILSFAGSRRPLVPVDFGSVVEGLTSEHRLHPLLEQRLRVAEQNGFDRLKEGPPSEEVLRYLDSSFGFVRVNRLKMIALGVAAVCFAILAGLATTSYLAERAANQEAERQRVIAVQQKEEALRNESKVLAASAQQEILRGNTRSGVKLALQGMPRPDTPERPYVADVGVALHLAVTQHREIATLHHRGGVLCASFNADGSRFVTGSIDEQARLWDAAGNQLATMQHHSWVRSVVFSPKGGFVLTASGEWTATDGEAIVWTSSGDRLLVLKHKKSVVSAAFSPDEKKIVTASEDGFARIWTMQGELVAELKHEKQLTSAEFSPDGKRIATASWDNAARVWDEDGRLLATLPHDAQVWSAHFSSDSKKIVTASHDGTARLWSADGNPIATLTHNAGVEAAQFSPDGTRILTGSWDKTARLWDLEGHIVISLPHPAGVYRTAFSGNGKVFVTLAADGAARLWDTEGQQLTAFWDAAEFALLDFQGSKAITGSKFSEGRLWDAGSQRPIRLPHKSWIVGVAFSPSGDRIATASNDHTARLWSSKGNPIAVMAHEDNVHTVAFDRDEQLIVTGSVDSKARIWNKDGALQAILDHHDKMPVDQAAFSPDGSRIVTVATTARLWSRTGELIAELRHGDRAIKTAAFSADSSLLVTAGNDGSVRLWDNSGKLRRICGLSSMGIPENAAAFDPVGNRIVTVSRSGLARLLDFECKEIAFFKHDNSIEWVAFSPGGDRIVTASTDTTARVWDRMGRPIAVLRHEDGVLRAIFSPDGGRVLTISAKTMRVWTSDGVQLASFPHEDAVLDAAFSPDGDYVVTGDSDTVARVFRVFRSLDDILKRAESISK